MSTAVKPEWPVVHVRIPMRATFPKSDPCFAGMIIERGRLCACGARYFPQWVVTKAYLESVGESFLANCELVARGNRSIAWYPKQCHKCARRII